MREECRVRESGHCLTSRIVRETGMRVLRRESRGNGTRGGRCG